MLERVINLTLLSILLTGTASAAELRVSISSQLQQPAGDLEATTGRHPVPVSTMPITEISCAPWISSTPCAASFGPPMPKKRRSGRSCLSAATASAAC